MFRNRKISFAILAFLIPSVALGATSVGYDGIKPGDQAIVPDFLWVTIKNPSHIPGADNSTFRWDKHCNIDRGNKVTVVGIDEDGKRVLLRYSGGVGDGCPTGTLFFVSSSTFTKMSQDYEVIMQKEQAELALINRLLQEE